ncbi:hypothetical protein BDW74DRAFT_175991 [Aspergillus multicolor]|uniref:chitin binding peritrophin-A domain-containing protein n=1 Tax=Aspergillus multicolor TaxID=41759 RepID=UPI003CCD5963
MHFTIKPFALLAASLLIATTTAAPNHNCHVGSAWPDHHDCHAFFECAAGGIPVRKVCGPGTAYSPDIGVCDYEWKVWACRHGHGHEVKHGIEEASQGWGEGGEGEKGKWEEKPKAEGGAEGSWGGSAERF